MVVMFKERGRDLALRCTELVRAGNEFPTVWATVLKNNPLVNGIPQSQYEGDRPVLVIRLFTGERLVVDGEAKKFTVR